MEAAVGAVAISSPVGAVMVVAETGNVVIQHASMACAVPAGAPVAVVAVVAGSSHAAHSPFGALQVHPSLEGPILRFML